MPEPSPYTSAFRWAWHKAKEYRARFWVSTVAFSLLAAGITAYVALPEHPTALQTFLAAVLGIAGAVVLTGVTSSIWALAAAPYQQRNALRGKVAELTQTVAELETAPVTKDHGDRLRQIAGHLQKCVEHHEPLDYGTDPGIWRRALREHFPDLQEVIDGAAAADAAFTAFKERLSTEAGAAGMLAPPWTPDSFLPWLATTIQGRAIQGILNNPEFEFSFDWQGLNGGSMFLGEPVYGNLQILGPGDASKVPERREAFEAFFRSAESWPEAAAIGRTTAERADKMRAVDKLAAAANTDPIRTRCFLCR